MGAAQFARVPLRLIRHPERSEGSENVQTETSQKHHRVPHVQQGQRHVARPRLHPPQLLSGCRYGTDRLVVRRRTESELPAGAHRGAECPSPQVRQERHLHFPAGRGQQHRHVGPEGGGVDAGIVRADGLQRRQHSLPAGPPARDRQAPRQAELRPPRSGLGRRASARAGMGADRAQPERRDRRHRAAHRRRGFARVAGLAHAGRRAARIHRPQLRRHPQLRLLRRAIRALPGDARGDGAGHAQPSRRRRALR